MNGSHLSIFNRTRHSAGAGYRPPPNHQEMSPLQMDTEGNLFYLLEPDKSYANRGATIVAKVQLSFPPRESDPEWWKRKHTGLLLTSAYNQFDRAGRELGVDANLLAEKIDLLGLLQFLRRTDFNPDQLQQIQTLLDTSDAPQAGSGVPKKLK